MAEAHGPVGLTVRRMAAGEVGLIRDWADAEGWNPGTHDGAAFYVADPDGFFVGELAGEPVACVACVRYGDRFGFLGQYIVRPGHRGQGFGLATWAAGMAHLGDRVVGLDGVLAQVPSYERSGFRFAHHHVRYAGVGGGTRPSGLVAAADLPFEAITDYDGRCLPGPRAAFLRAWLGLPGSTALAAAEVGRVRGYGVIRPSAAGFKVGPLFADDAATAVRLLAGLAAAAPGEPFCVDVPDAYAQLDGRAVVEAFGLTEVFRTARMYTGAVPAFDAARVFGVTSLELG
jgi:hypothetical protein